MVNTVDFSVQYRGRINLLSTGQVLRVLGITKQTLYKWIMLGKIKAITHEIGARIFLEFDPKEIDKIKSQMVRKREKGKPLIKE